MMFYLDIKSREIVEVTVSNIREGLYTITYSSLLGSFIIRENYLEFMINIRQLVPVTELSKILYLE